MDLDRVERVLKLLRGQPHVAAVTLEGPGWRVHVRQGEQGAPHLTPFEMEVPATAEEEQSVIRAGMVGIYRATDPPVRAGDYVSAGDGVGAIDSMRILNPVTAELGGYVRESLVEEGDPVEYGQVLFVLSQEAALSDTVPGMEGM